MDPEDLRGQLKKLSEQPAQPQHAKTEHTRADQPNPQVLFAWEAPVRAYKRKPAGVMRFYAALAILLSLLVVFFKEYILVIPIWSVMFLVYVLTITPPHIARFALTKFGVRAHDRTYRWEDLSHFYFIRKFDYQILVLFEANPYHAPHYLVMPDKKAQEHIFEILSDHLVFVEEPQKNFTDRMAEWLTTLMPEEESPAASSAHPEKLHEHRTSEPTA